MTSIPHLRLTIALALTLACMSITRVARAEEPPPASDAESAVEASSWDEAVPACLPEARALADEAKSLVVGEPARAEALYAAALACVDDPVWRAIYGFTMERQGRNCDALVQYLRAEPRLPARQAARVRESITLFRRSCTP